MSLPGSLTRVQRETDVDEEAAKETLRATLELLGHRISREEAKNVAGELPEEMETWIVDWDTHAERSFGVDEFLERLADRLDVDKSTAQRRAQAAFDALEQEIDPFERSKIAGQLPEEYEALL